MYLSTGSCKFLQTVVTDNFFANSWFGIFFAIYNNCHSGQIVCKFCKLGFPDKFTRWSRWPGRSGWAFDWFYVIFYVTFLIENFSEFDFHLTRERGTRRSPWNSRPGTLPFVPCLNFLCWKTFSFCAFPFLWSARTSCSTQDQSFCSYAPKI